MSDPVVHGFNDSAEKPQQSYHSAWMSHWAKKSYDAAIQNRICSSNSLGKKEHDHGNKEYLLMENNSIGFFCFQTLPKDHSQAFSGAQFQNIQNFSGFRLFQNQSKLPEVTKSQKLHQGYSSVPKFVRAIHDVEAMRIRTTVDSIVGVHRDHPRMSHSHSLLITKQTDFNLNKEKETFRNSRGFADGNAFSNLHNLSPPCGDGKNGAKLQPIGGFKDTEVEEHAENMKVLNRFTKGEETNVNGVEAFGNFKEDKEKNVEHDMVFDSNLKNESSAETDIMVLDEFEEKNQLCAANSSPSNKIIRLGTVGPRLALGSRREVGCGQPGMNFGLPALAAAGKMLDNGEPSNSRTQSLDMEVLLANAEQLSHSESEHCVGDPAKPGPSCIWVKRLKSTASDSFVGTKSSNSEPSYRENNLVLANPKGSMVNSEPTVKIYHGKELMVLDKTRALSRHGESFSSETSKDRDSLLSHSWIRRWCHCQAATPKKEPEPLVVCEPQSSNLALVDLQRKQFPSIAAMALMGKATSGFQPCQFQKKGSVVVWK